MRSSEYDVIMWNTVQSVRGEATLMLGTSSSAFILGIVLSLSSFELSSLSHDMTVFSADVTDYFVGHSSTTVTCHECNHQSKRQEKFYDISLHFPDGKSSSSARLELCEMLERSVQAEVMCGDNQFYCEQCSKYRKSRIYLLPEL